ncbi:MAG: Sua5/YciO/YrdC/YwlC family protein [Bifidobacteriaceae bacterium]|jgi:L-threonylcarbamoyladenylate synthase|nr:Sua5/YciO/YrdC/YwlC family protein [Bifidobacteriaceae bacterium]
MSELMTNYIDGNNKSPEQIVRSLKNGEIIKIQTDTLPGLICDPYNKTSVAKIFTIKKRPKTKKLPILVPNNWQEDKLIEPWTLLEKRLITKYWPGALTIIKHFITPNPPYLGEDLENDENLVKCETKEKSSVALRCPNFALLLQVLAKFGPVAGTSANISGQKPKIKTRPSDKVYFNTKTYSKGSTIIKVINKDIKIIRNGDLNLTK